MALNHLRSQHFGAQHFYARHLRGPIAAAVEALTGGGPPHYVSRKEIARLFMQDEEDLILMATALVIADGD